MNDYNQLKVKTAIIRIIGIFEETNVKKAVKKISDPVTGKYTADQNQNKNAFNKNYWYPEFRNKWFGNEEDSVKVYVKTFEPAFVTFTNKQKSLKAAIVSSEIYLCKNGLHLFSIELKPELESLAAYSDLMFFSRNFYSDVDVNQKVLKWYKWVEENILAGFKICSDENNQDVKVDEYSGSKFKLYTVFDMEEKLSRDQRMELLYDLGTVSAINTAGNDSPDGPSLSYYASVIHDRVSVFNNYDMLPLFDSFTVVGNDILTKDYQKDTYKKTYFSIILHTLLLKYNLYRYQTLVQNENPLLRDVFEKFLVTNNLSHLSYNFLPNIIYKKYKQALELDEELDKFNDRIARLSESIKELQQRKTNLLLGLIGAVTSVGSVGPVFSQLEKIRTGLIIHSAIFYCLILLVALPLVSAVLYFLFPAQMKGFIKKIRKR
jgi:hypothetical protein